jgi:hypothetical protein
MAESNSFNSMMDNLQNFFGRMGYGKGSAAYRNSNTLTPDQYGSVNRGGFNSLRGGPGPTQIPTGEEPFDFGKFLMRGLANSARAGQDFTQPVPIAGAQNVGVQRPGNPLQTLLSSIQRRRQGQQRIQRGFTGRV